MHVTLQMCTHFVVAEKMVFMLPSTTSPQKVGWVS